MPFERLVALTLDALSIFKSEYAIGVIVAVMLCAAIFVIIRIFISDLHQNFCIRAVCAALKTGYYNPSSSSGEALKRASEVALSYDYADFQRAWREYYSSVEFDRDANSFVSPLDPNMIFNPEALGFNMRRFDRISSLFVSVGLVLTFMGLVAALQQSGAAILSAGAADADIKVALSELLQVVSSKFILSITGLSCSIIINLAIERRTRYNRRTVEILNMALSKTVKFMPIEAIFFDIRSLLQDRLGMDAS